MNRGLTSDSYGRFIGLHYPTTPPFPRLVISLSFSLSIGELILFPFPQLQFYRTAKGKVWGSDEVNVEGWKPLKRLPGHESGAFHLPFSSLLEFFSRVRILSNRAGSQIERN